MTYLLILILSFTSPSGEALTRTRVVAAFVAAGACEDNAQALNEFFDDDTSGVIDLGLGSASGTLKCEAVEGLRV